ncbi:NADH-dependent flavin oxidoreductase [Paenibacillus sp. GCM10023250]|uniref:NADH-dependent flavin oxidoreductase n=1 Tax=Paenibacillus sp. GCM10023250 TaxID=3252648 RepID=UPI0036151C0F
MNATHQAIFAPFRLPSGVQLHNRIIMAPMTLTASGIHGEVTDDELLYYRARANGLGAVITSGSFVSQHGKVAQHGFGIDHDALIPGLRKLSAAIQENGTRAIVQLYHGGRKANPHLVPDGRVIGASAIAGEWDSAVVPHEMTEHEIEQAIDAFAEATRRAIEAGFDGVEIHGANGFLVQNFFSPHANRRTDRWGGTLEKRMAFPLEVIQRVNDTVAQHAAAPFAVGYRLAPEENEHPGITMDDTLQFVDVLTEQSLDYLHVSVDRFWAGPRHDASTATSRVVMIQQRAGSRIPVIGVGGLLTPEDVGKALATGVPLAALGHAIIMNPDWAHLVRSGREHELKTTISRSAQKALAIPDNLWAAIQRRPGWFPFVD